MTTIGKQTNLYILRLFIVTFAFVALPGWPVLFVGFIPPAWRWLLLLWLPAGLYLWARLSRRLLVESRYLCPGCNQKVTRIEVVEDEHVGHVYLTCPSCGHRERSTKVQWHAPSG